MLIPDWWISSGIGALSYDEAARAIRDPTQAAGVDFTDAALVEIFRLTQGYPYFLQEWGYVAWNTATASPIDIDTIERATTTVIARLDKNFFQVPYQRRTQSEKNYLRAMAELGPQPQRTSDIAEAIGVKVTSLGPVRAKLIRKGMVYSPAHGDMAFTVPLFDQFMMRAIPTFEQRRSSPHSR